MSNRELSEYAREFNKSCELWEDDKAMNLTLIRLIQHHFNDMLELRGTVYLNEVYDYLGIPKEEKYRNVGWKLDCECSDGFIDFGLCKAAIINGENPNIMLDFNVDGVINYDDYF